MDRHLFSKAGRANELFEAIQMVTSARKRREERDRLAKEARTKIFAMFPELTEGQLEAKWREVEEVAQLFREAHYSGEDGYRDKRIIELVWQGVENNQVNIERDREDNMQYTGGHLKVIERAGITPDQYEAKEAELREYLATAPEADWRFDKAIYESHLPPKNKNPNTPK